MDLTKCVPIEVLKQKVDIYERYVRMGSGAYSTKHYRDRLEFNKGAVWAIQGLLNEINERIDAQNKGDDHHRRFEPYSGTHYTGD